MTKPATVDSYDLAAAGIQQLLKKLRILNACPCCAARALLTMGAALAEEIGGTNAAAEELEGLAGDLRNNVKEAPNTIRN